MIRVDRLSKSFQGKVALEPLTLEIGTGEVFGLLGHNGAGKSTTFGLLLGHLPTDEWGGFYQRRVCAESPFPCPGTGGSDL